MAIRKTKWQLPIHDTLLRSFIIFNDVENITDSFDGSTFKNVEKLIENIEDIRCLL